MRRMLRSFRTRKNVRQTNALRDQFLRDLTREAEALMTQLSAQFTQTLSTQATQLVQPTTPGIVAGDQASALPAAGEPGSIGSVGQLLSTGVRYLVSRPRTSRTTQESTRSATTQAQFRTSRAQAAAELQSLLMEGEKNR